MKSYLKEKAEAPALKTELNCRREPLLCPRDTNLTAKFVTKIRQ
jgi:hypothetical protein